MLDRLIDTRSADEGRSASDSVAAGAGWPKLTLIESFGASHNGSSVQVPMAGQKLLALLAVNGMPIHRTYAASMLWLDSSDAHASGSLRSTLWRLGRLGACFVESSDGLLRLAPAVTVDLCDAEAQAHRLLSRDTSIRMSDLQSGTLTHDLLSGWYDDWVLIERERFHQLRLHALEAICERLMHLGRFGEAVEAGLSAVAGEPLRESAHRALIQAYLAEGNPIEAVRQFRSYAELLADELGAEPSPMIRDLVQGLSAS